MLRCERWQRERERQGIVHKRCLLYTLRILIQAIVCSAERQYRVCVFARVFDPSDVSAAKNSQQERTEYEYEY